MPEDSASKISPSGSTVAGDFNLLSDIDLPIKDDAAGFGFLDQKNEVIPVEGAGNLAAKEVVSSPILSKSSSSIQRVSQNEPKVEKLEVLKKQSVVSRKETVVPKKESVILPVGDAVSVDKPHPSLNHKPQPLHRREREAQTPLQAPKTLLQPTIAAPKLQKPPPSKSAQPSQGLDIEAYARAEVEKYLKLVKGLGSEKQPTTRNILKLRQQTSALKAVPAPSVSIGEQKPSVDALDQLIEKIIQETALSFSDGVMRARFFALAKSRLRDVRDKFEIADALVRSSKVGGMGFAEPQANKVAAMLEQEAVRYLGGKENRETPSVDKRKIPASAPKPPQADKPIQVPSAIPKPPKFSRQASVHSYRQDVLAKLEDLQKKSFDHSESIQKNSTPTVSEVRSSGSVPTSFSRPKKKMVIPQVIRPRIVSEKPTIHDVQGPVATSVPVNVMGPIEELRSMNLVNFRRLGVTPEMRAHKIKDKVDILEQDSFAMRTQGVDAWKNSEVNRLYLSIGQESIARGQAVSEIIGEKEEKNIKTLSFQEFQAIADLNKSLRY